MRQWWTTKEVKRLAEMAESGKSARLIGYELGRTKRSVIGAARRNSIPLLAKPGRLFNSRNGRRAA